MLIKKFDFGRKCPMENGEATDISIPRNNTPKNMYGSGQLREEGRGGSEGKED